MSLRNMATARAHHDAQTGRGRSTYRFSILVRRMTITDSIKIEAPVHAVWNVTQDVERWPEWTPTVTSVRLVSDPPLRLGSIALIRQPMQPESRWVVTEFAPGRRFAWETRRPGLHMVGSHDMTSENGGTRNILRIDASGWIAVLLWPVLRAAMRKALADENRGLKARCEGKAQADIGTA